MKYILFLLLPLVFFNCNRSPDINSPNTGTPETKRPLDFDESKVLSPSFSSLKNQALMKTTVDTYYDYSPPTISINDFNTMAGGGIGPNTGTTNILANGPSNFYSYNGVWIERTYSSRFNSYPEDLWYSSNGALVSASSLGDYEHAETFFLFDTDHPNAAYWDVTLDWSVSSEANYDYLIISSTSNSNCYDAGTIRLKTSGQQSGTLSFTLPSCTWSSGNPAWVGIYYIKDYSVSSGSDDVKIDNVYISPLIPVSSGN